MAQQTALDLYRSKLLTTALVSNSIRDLFINEEHYFLQAKAMEKDQMFEFANGYADAVLGGFTQRAEEYYNKNSGK